MNEITNVEWSYTTDGDKEPSEMKWIKIEPEVKKKKQIIDLMFKADDFPDECERCGRKW